MIKIATLMLLVKPQNSAVFEFPPINFNRGQAKFWVTSKVLFYNYNGQ